MIKAQKKVFNLIIWTLKLINRTIVSKEILNTFKLKQKNSIKYLLFLIILKIYNNIYFIKIYNSQFK